MAVVLFSLLFEKKCRDLNPKKYFVQVARFASLRSDRPRTLHCFYPGKPLLSFLYQLIAEWKYTRLYSTIVNMNWHKFLSKKDLLSCKDHLPGDTLKLRAELTVSSLSFSLHF
jgi:hypothetical protein